ncbi:MAG: CapA family protein [Clostridia bacterium]|nr:CapA family protein [Clostridia bacterium]
MIRFRNTLLSSLLFLCFLLAWPLCGLALEVRFPDKVTGYTENAFEVTSDTDGMLEMTLSDRYLEYTHLSLPVRAGTNHFTFDGLSDNSRRIGHFNVKYTYTALFTSEDGQVEEQAGTFTTGKSRQALLFALPSADTLYRGSDWFVELLTTRSSGFVQMTVTPRGKDKVLYTRNIPVKRDTPFVYRWDGAQRKTLPEGEYELRFVCPDNPGYSASFPLTISDAQAPEDPLEVTGAVLPEDGMTEAEIWEIMQKPSVVVDIGETSHQKVYQEKSRSSRVLGTLHGQSQALEVLEIDENWAYITAWEHEDGERITGYVPRKVLKVVRPSSRYGLLIDKRNQTMQVFEKGSVIATLPISTGLVAKDRLIRETASGAFLTQRRVDDFTDSGYHYELPIRYDGGNLIHSVGYTLVSRYADYAAQTESLGQKASHGCIRVPAQSDTGVDSWFLWTHLPYHTRVIVLDDPEVRRAQAQDVRAGRTPQAENYWKAQEKQRETDAQAEAEPTEVFAEALFTGWEDIMPVLPEEGQREEKLVLTIGGDAVLGTREAWQKKENAFPMLVEKYGMDWPFSGLSELFATDDLTMVNLEGVLKDSKAGEQTEKLYRFRGKTEYTRILQEGSVEHVNLANNHYIDYGEAGKKSTRQALEEAGIPYSGYGYTWVFEKNGVRVGFAGIRETTYLRGKGQIETDIRALREAGCDVVIYTCHWGTEYSATHNALQEEMAAEAVRCGADLVIGGHPHVVQGIENVQGVPVVWSLGNLVFGGTIDLTTFDAALARVTLYFTDGAYTGVSVEMVPILTSSLAQSGINDCHPVVAEGEDRERILQKIAEDSTLDPTQIQYFPARQ